MEWYLNKEEEVELFKILGKDVKQFYMDNGKSEDAMKYLLKLIICDLNFVERDEDD